MWIKSCLFSLLFPKNLAPRTEIVPVPGPGHHLIHDVSNLASWIHTKCEHMGKLLLVFPYDD